MADQTLDSFLAGLQGNLLNQTTKNQITPAVKVDDGMVLATTRAPNAIEWSTGINWLGVQSLYHHVRQYQIIRDFYQLRCPLSSCNDQSDQAKDCWGKGREYLESENLLVYGKYNEDSCPSCGTTRSEFVQDGLLPLNNQMHLVCGMRSGKTSVAAVMGTYIEHVVSTVGHRANGLDKYFDQLPGQKFDITFIASTDVQSKDTIWAKYTELRRNSPWFVSYVRWLKKQEIEQQTPNGIKPLAYEELDKEIRNDFLGLNIKSMNSNSGGMAGRTRIAAFIDELARFEVTESNRGGDEVYRVLENSLRTIRSQSIKHDKSLPWLGTMISVSSPISIEDKSMRLLKQAPSIKGMYAAHYATWDFNPEQPREMFDDDFSKDPIGAMRDFGAQPPSAASPLISDPATFRKMAIQQDLRPTASMRQILHTDRSGREYISAVLDSASLSRDGERFICFDASSSFDQFAGACAHGEWVQTPEGRQLVTVFDWVFRLLPEAKPRRDVWFDFVIQIVEQMSKMYLISRIEFDRWQSTYLIQQIRDRGVPSEVKGIKFDHWVKFVNDVNFGRVRMLPPMPGDENVDPPLMSAQGLAFYELDRLEKDTSLGKVGNPRKGQRRGYNSDDVATVVVHVNDMVQSTVVDLNTSNTRQVRLHREQMGGANWSGRGALLRPRNNGPTGRGW